MSLPTNIRLWKKVADSDKRSSLLQYRISYNCIEFIVLVLEDLYYREDYVKVVIKMSVSLISTNVSIV
jgi:hypothetical protein